MTSTVWLSRDLRDEMFWVLKVHVNTLKHNQELAVYEHLSGLGLDHPGRQHQTLVTTALDQTLLGLNYLHDASVIHTDIHSDNLLIAITDDSILFTVEDNELQRPSYMLGGAGAFTICDLGQARIGEVHRGNAMPVPYRAPEVILGMTWGNAVDIWSVGLLREGIFRIYDQSEELNDAYHLAAMTALLGPPPDVFLRRSDKTSKYWNAEGKRRDAIFGLDC
ncbi:hypothetical protein LCI18_001864 [Fusarium solani-melongenae]|uniref:Uncharacterized protein n=1 Tax=Fusarium solani subsp. cucurbitae TaxID=2747967 RepID=A0ACD3YPP8_FUSSC|nr:hypothetical protein LCI18_001864 [Fusarium solani-melongenae]